MSWLLKSEPRIPICNDARASMTPSSTPRRNAVPALWRWPAKYVSQVSVCESKWRTARGPWRRPERPELRQCDGVVAAERRPE